MAFKKKEPKYKVGDRVVVNNQEAFNGKIGRITVPDINNDGEWSRVEFSDYRSLHLDGVAMLTEDLELAPIKDSEELLSNCCSAKPCGEMAYDNSGRCGDCKEGCMFVEPKEDTTEPTRYAMVDGKKAYLTVEEVVELVRAVKSYRYGMDEFNDGVDETKEKIVRKLRKLK